MKSTNKVTGGVALLIIIVLGLWWFSASQPLDIQPLDLGVKPAGTAAGGTTKTTKANVTVASRASSDVLSVAQDVAGAGEFSSLLSSTGVASEIRSTGQYTILVAKDSAFAKLPKGSITGLSAAEKKRLVEYHVISGRAIDPDAVLAGSVTTLSRDPLNFTVNADGSASAGTAKIVTAYKAKNGVVLIIDSVLFPPKKSGI